MSQWVQHISGQGAKWPVMNETAQCWGSMRPSPDHPSEACWLPKSEYVICDPPEQWIDVTADCEAQRNGQGVLELWHYQHRNRTDPALVNLGYRVRKVLVSLRIGDFVASAATGQQGWAFLVERRMP